MGNWSDPTECLTEAEERAMEAAYREQQEHDLLSEMDEAFEALVLEADDLSAKHRAYLSKLESEPLYPDVEAMRNEPAKTCNEAVNLLDAVKERNAK